MSEKANVKVEARIAGGALVVSFMDDGLPKVWRTDIARLASAAFELKEDQGKFCLILKTPTGVEDIFLFTGRGDAALGLQAITQALFSGDHGTSSVSAQKKSGFFGKLLKVILYSIIVVLCLMALTIFLHAKSTNMGGGLPLVREGMPVPADQMFGK
jgi:hypothetical protein